MDASVPPLALAWFGAAGFRRPRMDIPESPDATTLDRRWLWFLVAMLIVGALVRFIGLDTKGLSHPEAYLPGINLAPGISVAAHQVARPPERSNTAPVANEQSSEQSHATCAAISSTSTVFDLSGGRATW